MHCIQNIVFYIYPIIFLFCIFFFGNFHFSVFFFLYRAVYACSCKKIQSKRRHCLI